MYHNSELWASSWSFILHFFSIFYRPAFLILIRATKGSRARDDSAGSSIFLSPAFYHFFVSSFVGTNTPSRIFSFRNLCVLSFYFIFRKTVCEFSHEFFIFASLSAFSKILNSVASQLSFVTNTTYCSVLVNPLR